MVTPSSVFFLLKILQPFKFCYDIRYDISGGGSTKNLPPWPSVPRSIGGGQQQPSVDVVVVVFVGFLCNGRHFLMSREGTRR